MLEIYNLKKMYNRCEALKGVSFSIETNSIVGLIGDNGAGKTTLIKCISGLVEPTSGEIYLNGHNLLRDEKYIRDNIGVLLEGARNLYNFLTVEYNLNYFGLLNGLSQIEIDERKRKLTKEFDVEKYKNMPVNMLSRGTQQKVALMVTLMKNPKFLILDEPTLGLDLISTIRMTDLLKQIIVDEEKTVILISHDMTLITSLCDRVIYLRDGKVNFDERVEHILDENIFELKLSANANVKNTLEKNNIEYKYNEGIYCVMSSSLDSVVNIVPAQSIISIEKQPGSLQSFIKRNMA